MRVIVVPQGVRNVLPALAGQFIIDIKESALVYLLGLGLGQRELYFIAQERQAATYNSSALVAAGACYLLLTVPLTFLVNRLDLRLRDGGRRQSRATAAPSPVPPSTPSVLEV
jgi:polar amino acid transport system permease protein/polar amino acid transport system substrate-binding protein